MRLAPNVKRGINLLDRLHPGFEERINLANFVMQEACDCIVGQIINDGRRNYGFDSFWSRMKEYLDWCIDNQGYVPKQRKSDYGGPGTFKFSGDYGFNTVSSPGGNNCENEYLRLEKLWTWYINRRRLVNLEAGHI